MNDYDYQGDMDFFQDQLSAVGITVEQFDITNYCGCTARELQGIVNSVIANYKAKQKQQ